VPSDEDLSDSMLLYSESAGRFVVTIDPSRKDSFEKLFAGMAIGCIGVVTESSSFKIYGRDDSVIIEEEIMVLKDCWKELFGGLI
jgi:phosphoribosylformylglycinamidine synthase